MRIAILSDIHGNSIALDAVLAHIQMRGGVDAYWLLGDYVANGVDPIGVLERLATLKNKVVVRGNTDRYVVTGERPMPYLEEVEQDPALIPLFAQVAASFAWTAGKLDGTRWVHWLAALPLQEMVTLPDGQQALLVHVSPGHDDGRGLTPVADRIWLQIIYGKVDQRLICVGHTHVQMEKHLPDQHLVNPGSVGNPISDHVFAGYALLEASRIGYAITFEQVYYRVKDVIAQLEASNHPAKASLLRFYRGQHIPEWERKDNP